MEYDEAVRTVRDKCDTIDQVYELLRISPSSPEGWYASVVWDALHPAARAWWTRGKYE